MKLRTIACSLLALATACAAQRGAVHGQAGFSYANDFFTATDRYFTQGVRVEVGTRSSAPLLTSFLRLRGDTLPLVTFFAEQDCYTPGSIRSDTIRRSDRPFAAVLYVGATGSSVDPMRGLRLSSTLIAGVVGPCASCAEEQMWIHHGLGNIEPLGWQYQLHTAPVLNGTIGLERRLHRTGWTEISGAAAVSAGTLRDALAAELTLRIGKDVTGFRSPWERRAFAIAAFASVQAQAIAFDATMQGGILQRNDPHTLPASAVERLVAGYTLGGTLEIHRLELSYSETVIGRSFRNGLRHGWGMVGARFRF